MPTVLSVAYPLAPVGPDAVGGAEQVLSLVEAGLVRRGWRSLVVAAEGSRVAGTLVELARPRGALDGAVVAAARERAARVIASVVRRLRVDIVHMHGHDFAHYLPPPGVPVLASVHCPPEWYELAALAPSRADTYLVPVSSHLAARLPAGPSLLSPVENGVAVDRLRPLAGCRPRGFALVLGRIAPDKGIHVALDAARQAGMSMLVAGALFEYPEHRRYVERHVLPHLDAERRWIGPVGMAGKRSLLARARCLVVTSEAAETSSLVAREAAACGTPVVALDRGALAETVRHGVTGLVVRDARDLPGALHDVARLDRGACRREAVARFSADPMVDGYIARYRQVLTLAGHGRSGRSEGAGACP